jgi:DNA-binding beta-propeller fold protein YncE
VVSADGQFLYVANTATNSVGVYSLADPLHPVQIQDLVLSGPQSAQGATAVFQLAIDPTGRSLYVIGQSTDPAVQQGNQLHTLTIARDGTLTERTGPVLFAPGDVPGNAHPQGVAVVALDGRPHHDFFFGPDVDDQSEGHDRGRG